MPILTKGLSVPIGVSKSGGIKLNNPATHFTQTLMLAFSEGDDKNAFQDIGISTEILYDISNSATQAKIKRIVEKIARKFESRIVLDEQRPITFEKSDRGEITMNVSYVDLAINDEKNFSITFSGPAT